MEVNRVFFPLFSFRDLWAIKKKKKANTFKSICIISILQLSSEIKELLSTESSSSLHYWKARLEIKVCILLSSHLLASPDFNLPLNLKEASSALTWYVIAERTSLQRAQFWRCTDHLTQRQPSPSYRTGRLWGHRFTESPLKTHSRLSAFSRNSSKWNDWQ